MENKLKPYINISSVLHYLGYGDNHCEESLIADIERASAKVLDVSLNLCLYKQFDDIDSFGFTGNDIKKHLEGCEALVLTGITLGAGIERIIRAANVTDVKEALLLDTCASVCVESLNEIFIDSIAQTYGNMGLYITGGYSPGYGDLDIKYQSAVAHALNVRKIGLTLNEDCLLVPRKSCLSIIGISKNETKGHLSGCDTCLFGRGCDLYKKGFPCRR